MLSPASFSSLYGADNTALSGPSKSDSRANNRPDPTSPDDPGKGLQITDRVEISAAGRQAAEKIVKGSESKKVSENGSAGSTEMELTQDELRSVEELKQRDREVRAHELAHLANAGQYSGGGATFTYQTGADGKRYAVGGEVPIDTSKERTPEQTIQKMQTIRRAAMAPANPSPADRSIAATASQKEAEARRELQASMSGTSQTDDEKESAPSGIPPTGTGNASPSSNQATARNSSLNGADML